MTKKIKTTLLIDGDVFVYKTGLAVERPINWGNDIWTLHADAAEAKETLDATFDHLKEVLQADAIRVALSCPTEEGFRRSICPTYKLNRKGLRKPVVHQALREYLLDNYDALLRPQLEADDILGILSTQPTQNERRIIVSVDKDFKGVPGWLYRVSDDDPELVQVTPEEAARFHAIQTLSGDRVDGYDGIPGCGPKTAEKIIDGVPTVKLWGIILKAYKEAGLSKDVALMNARLARILQWSDYNIKTDQLKLWSPSPKS